MKQDGAGFHCSVNCANKLGRHQISITTGLFCFTIKSMFRKSCQLDIGLDLTMDNLTFGSMAYETIWMCCTRTVGQKSWWHSRVCKEAAMYQLTTLILLTTSKEGIPSQLVKRRMDDLEQIGFSWDIITSDETMQFINQNPNIQEQQRLSLHCHKSRRQ